MGGPNGGHFADEQHVSYCGQFSTDAAARLLVGSALETGEFVLRVNDGEPGAVTRKLRWIPPSIQIACEHCSGTGEFVGRASREKCDACGGSGYLRTSFNEEGLNQIASQP
jgi:hypothetical protein